MSTGLPLLDWAPTSATAFIIPFPLERRTAKVRDVAGKLSAKATPRAVDQYRRQVTAALLFSLQCNGVPPDLCSEQVRRFWVAVDLDLARRRHPRGQRPGGGAA